MAIGFCIIALGVVAFSLPPRSEPRTNRAHQETLEIPEHVIYRHVFHHAYILRERAEYRRQANLSEEQERVLLEIAIECEQEVQQQDARAKIIIDAYRARYPGGRVPTGETPPPPPAELRTLQTERNAIILRARDRLRTAFSEQEFERFNEFVRRRVAPNITSSPPNR